MEKQAYSYIRFSRPEQLKGNSLQRQKEWGEHWCKVNNVSMASLQLRDLGISAYKGRHAEKGKLGLFLDLVESGKIPEGSILLIESLDRFSREEIDTSLDRFRSVLKKGVEIVTRMPEAHFKKSSLNDPWQLMSVIMVMSRANEESKSKGGRVGDAWQTKRNNIKEKKLTARAPAWLKLSADKKTFTAIPEYVETLKLIYKLAIEGNGLVAIVKKLNKEKVKTFTKAQSWSTSTVLRYLRDREVLGEFQPRLGDKSTYHKKREKAGELITDYFPEVIDKRTWHLANQALDKRKQQRGPNGKDVANLFTGLITDVRDGSKIHIDNKGKENGGLTMIPSGAKKGLEGSKYISFPYFEFEFVVLRWLKELTPEDLSLSTVNTDHQKIQIQTLEAEVKELDLKIKETTEAAENSKSITALLRLLEKFELSKELLIKEIEALRKQVSSVEDISLQDTKQLLDLLQTATGEELIDLRTKLKSVIAGLIKNIWVLISDTEEVSVRVCEVQIEFEAGGFRRLQIYTRRGYRLGDRVRERETWYEAPFDAASLKPKEDIRNYNRVKRGESI